MRILDRMKNPLWSSVATSTLSGLCLLAVTGAISSLFEPGLLTTSVPLWSLLGTSAAVVVASSSLLLQRRSRGHRTRRAFMIISAFDQKHYLADLIRNVHDVLEQHGCTLELKIPQRDYSPASQMHCLEQVIANKNDYIGGLIIPIIPKDPVHARADLTDFCGKIGTPVVFLDVEPFEVESQYPPRTAFVGYHAAHIGEAAADWIAEHLLRTQQSPHPVVLVVGGAAQYPRQQKFEEQLAVKLSSSRIIEDNAEFDRGRAREVTRK